MTEGPWTRKNVAMCAAFAAVGCLLWAVGWYRVSGEPATEGQLASLNLVVAGLAIVGVAYALWFLAGRRAVGIRRRLLLTPAPVKPAHAQPGAEEADVYMGAQRFFHRPQCPMTADRGWAAVDKSEHVRSGRVACGVCAP